MQITPQCRHSPASTANISTWHRILHLELDKGKVYATLGKYFTILAFELLHRTEYHFVSVDCCPRLRPHHCCYISGAALLDTRLNSPLPFPGVALEKVAPEGWYTIWVSLQSNKHKAPHLFCTWFVVWLFIYLLSTFSSCNTNRNVWFLGKTGWAGKFSSKKLTIPHYQISRHWSTWKILVFCY